jgi:hypothetical protein
VSSSPLPSTVPCITSTTILAGKAWHFFSQLIRARVPLAFAPMLLLSACQTVELGEAASLAKAGQQTSGEMSSFYSSTRETLPRVLEIEVLRSALEPGVSPPSPAMEASIAKIKKSLRLRQQLAGDLAKLYDSLYELSATDYPGNFTVASEGLLGSISALATSVGAANPIGEAQAAFINQQLGRLIRAKQKQKVKAANEIVLQQLLAVQAVLAEDRRVTTSLRRATARQLEQGGISLWRAGTLSAKPLLAKYANISGLELTGEEQDFTSKNVRLREAVPALIRYRFRQIDEAEDARYDAMEETVAGLIKRHNELREEKPINLEWLLAQVAKLQALKEELQALRAA